MPFFFNFTWWTGISVGQWWCGWTGVPCLTVGTAGVTPQGVGPRRAGWGGGCGGGTGVAGRTHSTGSGLGQGVLSCCTGNLIRAFEKKYYVLLSSVCCFHSFYRSCSINRLHLRVYWWKFSNLPTTEETLILIEKDKLYDLRAGWTVEPCLTVSTRSLTLQVLCVGASGAVDGGNGGERTHFCRWALCTVHLSRQAVIPRGAQGGSTSTAFIARRANAAARALKKIQIFCSMHSFD